MPHIMHSERKKEIMYVTLDVSFLFWNMKWNQRSITDLDWILLAAEDVEPAR